MTELDDVTLDVLRVFCGPDGGHGNPLGVVREGSLVPGRAQRQALAGRLGYAETVFVDDPERGVLDIYTPTARLPFAGHPCVGTAWLLDVPELVTEAGVVEARQDGEFSWITAAAAWAGGRQLKEYRAERELAALEVPPAGTGWIYAWAWQDEAAGRVRTRGFPGRPRLPRGDGPSGPGAPESTAEDEATGAAAMLLTHHLGRALNITQGSGSQLITAPGPDGTVELGGRVALVASTRL
ncbi:Trans-2,3-dihydro-3-hydroxyanthranilate isomerase [Streptomyces sp. YIM 130001]|uniref:PhzF family phenazine biosynthesis protein n=1 Tax=Streptomyces sp. YIM 130001 TaxID=2259644 RepID=UPI000EE9E230|nr:PhzF family phenazine biosynthesis protein [Streptomyces sp. YIM 130001]RII17054.1 Trans-2,3-dihydro-3-hydroxyanthranilate isomerase [Streptomyces sp. YIM 130001]